MNEAAVLLGQSRSLVGIITAPEKLADARQRPAVLLLNAGLVHRVGPHSLYVYLARRLAAKGYLVVRFDFSGLGDSPACQDKVPYAETRVLETREVMDSIAKQKGIERFCLMGLSSGAVASFQTSLQDSRVVGTVLLNPHGFDQSGEWSNHVDKLSTMRIYMTNLFRLESWFKIVSGKTDYRRLQQAVWYRLKRSFTRSSQVTHVARRLVDDLKDFLNSNVRTLLVFSVKDRSIENFDSILGQGWQKGLDSTVTLVDIPEANHTFAGPFHQEQVLDVVEHWMNRFWPAVPETENSADTREKTEDRVSV